MFERAGDEPLGGGIGAVKVAARQAGAKPKIAAATKLEMTVKISTVESIRIVSSRGRCAGAMASSS